MYDYNTELQKLMTPDGARKFQQIKHKANSLLEASGAFTFNVFCSCVCGDRNLIRAALETMANHGLVKLAVNLNGNIVYVRPCNPTIREEK